MLFRSRARLGQYLGFSPDHSSLVALVRHLGTGHVSPQWHVVFDDKFESVFSTGCISDDDFDRICSTLYDESRDWYLEPEDFDDDGDLVYEPPPLDEVYLNEEERRERKERLDRQRSHNRRTRVKFEEAFLPEVETPSSVVQFDTDVELVDSSAPPPPSLAPTDDEDSLDNSVSEGVPLPESEGDVVDESSVDVDKDEEIYDEDVPFNEEEALQSVDNNWTRKLRDRSKLKKTKKFGNVTSTTWEEALHYSPRDMAHLSARSTQSFVKKRVPPSVQTLPSHALHASRAAESC